MHNHITVIHDHPAITGEALLLSLFFMLGSNVVNSGIGKRIDHAVTGAGTNNEIIVKETMPFRSIRTISSPFLSSREFTISRASSSAFRFHLMVWIMVRKIILCKWIRQAAGRF